MFYLHVYVCIVHSAHCVWKFTVIFSRILNSGPRSCTVVYGGPNTTVRPRGRGRGGGLFEAPGEGPLRGPRGGGSNSLAPALGFPYLSFPVFFPFLHFPPSAALCRNFHSCIFQPCILVPHFPVSHFPPPAKACRFVPHFPVLHFPVSHFQRPHSNFNSVIKHMEYGHKGKKVSQ